MTSGAWFRKWLAHAGESTNTTSAPSSIFSGHVWAAAELTDDVGPSREHTGESVGRRRTELSAQLFEGFPNLEHPSSPGRTPGPRGRRRLRRLVVHARVGRHRCPPSATLRPPMVSFPPVFVVRPTARTSTTFPESALGGSVAVARRIWPGGRHSTSQRGSPVVQLREDVVEEQCGRFSEPRCCELVRSEAERESHAPLLPLRSVRTSGMPSRRI